MLVDQARRIQSGESIYRADLDQLPCAVANYPPVYPFLLAAVAPPSASALFHAGRLISVVAALISAALVGALALKLSRHRFAALLSATLFLGHPAVMGWAALARVDLLGTALSLLALWILCTRWRSWRWLVVSVLCLTASIYTRQSYLLAVPLAGTAWLWRCERRRGAVFLLGLACTVGLVFFPLNAVTGGGYWLNTVAANLGPFSGGRLLGWGVLLLSSWPIVLAVSGLQILQLLKHEAAGDRTKSEPPEERAFLLYGLMPYTVGAFGSALTIGKVGSDVNYLVELVAALALWAGTASVWRAGGDNRTKRVVFALMVLQTVWIGVIDSRLTTSAFRRWATLPELERLFVRVDTVHERGPILADDRLDLVVLLGERIYFDPFGCEQARLVGLWDPNALIQEIEGQQFPLILLSSPGSSLNASRWASRITEAIEVYYAATGEMHGTVIYEPIGVQPKNCVQGQGERGLVER